MQAFNEFSLSPALIQAVDALGYAGTTPIQAESLPVMLAGKDVVAKAKTGSGKTAAFGLALLQRLQPEQGRLQALVICPTRELADQVAKSIRALARCIPNVKILSLCGGVPIRHQLTSLVHEPHIVVGTPGRLQDLLSREALSLDALQCVVLDEADRMLDMGFIDEITEILAQAPAKRLTWLFSATYPPQIQAISKQFQREPVTVEALGEHAADVIKQQFFEVDIEDKPDAVVRLLLECQPESCLIFCNTKQDVRELVELLWQHGIASLELHGDLEQRDRDESLLQFANGSSRVLVATDVAARGLDIKALPLVIAYELPNDPEVHIHRIGRTGRAGERGQALTLVAPRELRRLRPVEQEMGQAAGWGKLPERKPDASLPLPAMQTLLIDAGRKDKLRPGDILGALTGEAGLNGDQIGKIDITPMRSYVAIQRGELEPAREKLRAGKIKGRRIRVRRL